MELLLDPEICVRTHQAGVCWCPGKRYQCCCKPRIIHSEWSYALSCSMVWRFGASLRARSQGHGSGVASGPCDLYFASMSTCCLHAAWLADSRCSSPCPHQ
jgi:hypothetical protein